MNKAVSDKTALEGPVDRYVFSTIVRDSLASRAEALPEIAGLLRAVRSLAKDRERGGPPTWIERNVKVPEPSVREMTFGDSRTDLIGAAARLVAGTSGGSTEVPDTTAAEALAGEMLAKLLLYFADTEVDVKQALVDYCHVRMFGSAPVRG